MTLHPCPRCDCEPGDAFAPLPSHSSAWARREALRAAEAAVRAAKEARKKPNVTEATVSDDGVAFEDCR